MRNYTFDINLFVGTDTVILKLEAYMRATNISRHKTVSKLNTPYSTIFLKKSLY